MKEIESSLKELRDRLTSKNLDGYIVMYPDGRFEVIFAESYGHAVGDEVVYDSFGDCKPYWN